MSTAPLLDVRGLSVSFAGNKVVHGIDFSITPGERVALVGESGSGKTVSALSLLRLVANADLGGQAVFEGHDLLAMPERELRAVRGRDIAMIFQEPMTALNPLMTIGDQIAEVLTLKTGLAKAQAAQKVIDLLAETGIPEPARRVNAFAHQLSGGQRQRAMIAMALACQPKLLLADEPTTALDVSLRGQILDLLVRLQQSRGMAVLLISHDLNLVRRFADRVIVMENGSIVEQGATAEVFTQPQHAYTQRLIASRPVRDVVEEVQKENRPVMRAKGLRVIYPTPLPGVRGWFKRGEFVALQGADFEIVQGQTLGIMGESGSGKSTLALAAQPKLLLADEPTTALDVSLRGQILDLLVRLQQSRGMAVLLISHDLNLVRRFADRVIVMENGSIVEQGATAEVFTQPQHAYTQRLIASRPVRDVVEEVQKENRPVMRAKGLRVIYPTPLPGVRGWFKRGEFVALQGADFEIVQGQTLGIMGESGSGKSTLALAALGLLPFQGALHINGQAWGANAAGN
ncbi:MAG: hypothetical protein AUK51_12345, partial [Comamonadaceae bacterium CG2_30_59_20]